MMKKFKKLISCMIAAVMILAMGVTAFAAQSGAGAGATSTYTITINGVPSENHTFTAYQVFEGDLFNGVLSNVEWGADVNGEALLSALTAEGSSLKSHFEDCNTAADVAKALANFATNSENVDAFAVIVNASLKTEGSVGTNSAANPTATTTNEKTTYTYKIEGLEAGYYFVKDTGTLSTDVIDAQTKFILELTGNEEVTVKTDVPSSEKKVDDKNDSTTSEDREVWQDSADYDIGDHVPYQLKATLPNNISDYTSYTLQFVDTMSKGLTYDKDTAEVFVDGDSVGKVEPSIEDYSGNNPKYTGGKVLTWDLGDITKAPYNAEDNAVITIEYTATLNENAVIGAAGNPNMSHIEFSNNPNGSGTGKTPDDTNIVFTYKTVVDKVDGEEQSLAGAEFTLEKFVANEDGSDTYNEVKGTWTDAATATLDEKGTQFTFTGLDDGVYRLTETKTPDGYNTIEPIIFTVAATHDEEADEPVLKSLSGTAETGEITFTAVVNAGSLSTTVINESGTILPETGGIGTRIFYAVGAILMIGAVVLLISRKRSAR